MAKNGLPLARRTTTSAGLVIERTADRGAGQVGNGGVVQRGERQLVQAAVLAQPVQQRGQRR